MNRMTVHSIDALFKLFDVDPTLPDPNTYKEDVYRKTIVERSSSGHWRDISRFPAEEKAHFKVYYRKRLRDPSTNQDHWFWVEA